MRELKVTYEGKPLEVLNALIERRSKMLGQTVVEAVAATMVNVLRSVRAGTRNALKRKTFDIVVEDTGWYGGFSYHKRTRVVRQGVSPYAPEVSLDKRVVWLTFDKPRQSECHIYKVTDDRGYVYYAGARTAGMVQQYELKRLQNRINHYGGLARNTLSVAMNAIASKTLPLEGGGQSQQKSITLADVETTQSGDTYTMRVTSNVEYGIEALKNGAHEIDIAMMKAANKSAGILNHIGGLDFGEKIQTPFPEVKQRRRK